MDINLKGAYIFLPFKELDEFSNKTLVHLTDESLYLMVSTGSPWTRCPLQAQNNIDWSLCLCSENAY